VFPGTKAVRLVDVDPPSNMSDTGVTLRMLDVGLCGTDREICAFEYGTPPPSSDYLVLGHEALAEVVTVGSAVSRCRPGDLVVPTVRRPCPHAHCPACRSDRQDFCFTDDFTERGIKQAHGFLAETAVEDERYLAVVPRELRDVGVLAEPLTIAEKALTQIWQVQERLPWGCPVEPGKAPGYCRSALVLGAGPIGLLGAMVLIEAGFATFIYSREPATSPQAAVAGLIGATYLSSESLRLEDLPERIGNIDVIYEAVGAAPVAFDALKALGTCGIFVLTGVPGRRGPIHFDADTIMRNLVLKNQAVVGTVNAGLEAYERAIRDLGVFVRRWPEAVHRLITTRVPLEAYREVLLGETGVGIKRVITMAS
jgi:threonine dehydrogenase-like Zn-dependent dehydrogenase